MNTKDKVYVRFEQVRDTGKTKVWRVHSIAGEAWEHSHHCGPEKGIVYCMIENRDPSSCHQP